MRGERATKRWQVLAAGDKAVGEALAASEAARGVLAAVGVLMAGWT
ncbi:hypothetical protein ACP4OV_021115 [Aristida adscensionis]